MLLVLLVSGTLGWIIYRARVQRDAVAVLEQAGGEVYYDWEWRDGKPILYAHEPQPRILIKLIGPDYFHAVKAVDLDRRGNNSLLRAVGSLDQLEELNLFASPDVTDAGVVYLRGLTHLKSLDFAFTNITGAGLKHLRQMKQLKALDLLGASINDSDLENLSALICLESLYIDASGITNTGLVHLRGLVNLQSLDLRNGPLTSDGLVNLHGMIKLHDLGLYGTKVTNLEAIAHLRELESLDLRNTPVDDSALPTVEYIAAMGKPVTLVVSVTKATKPRVVRLMGQDGPRTLVVH